METKIAIFKGIEVRKTIHNNEWWFSIIDIIEALTDSTKPRDYWYRLKKREKEGSGVELSTFCRQLKLKAKDGKMRETENEWRKYGRDFLLHIYSLFLRISPVNVI